MIFLDANVLLRFLTKPTDEASAHMNVASRSLVAKIEDDLVEATFSEVVFHEVCFILNAKKHYGLTWNKIASVMVPILQMRSLRLTTHERSVYLRALEIVVLNPKLESADALVLARCEIETHTLATFDRLMRKSSPAPLLNLD